MTVRAILISTFLVLGLTSPAWALLGPELSVLGRVGLITFSEDELDSAPLIAFGAAIRQGHFGGEISIEWLDTDVEDGGKLGTLTVVPVLLTARFFPMEPASGVDPYVGLGIGYFNNSFDADTNPKLKIDDTVGLHLNAGADVRVTTAVAFSVDLRYHIAEADATFGAVSDEVNLNGLVVSGGVKYFFPN